MRGLGIASTSLPSSAISLPGGVERVATDRWTTHNRGFFILDSALSS